MENIKFSKAQIKLLNCIYHHNRESLSQLAKHSGLSRKKVDYNLNQFVRKGIIKKFFPVINYSKLDYKNFTILFIKFNKPKYIEDFKKEHKRDSSWFSRGNIYGKYDIFVNLIFKNEKERNEYLSSLLSKNRETISDYLILEPYFSELFPLKFLENKKENSFVLIDSSSKTITLDEKEKKILKALEKDGRAKIIDIAKSSNISAELATYKIKQLQKEGVLLGTRVQFDMKKLGYNYTVLLINFKHFSSSLEKRIKDFARNHKFVNSLGLMFSKPNCTIQFFYKDEEELRNSIKDFKKYFDDESYDLDILHVEDEEEINVLPFLN